jgi:hypothetical protein
LDFSRLSRYELVGLLSSALLVISLFLPWYELGGSREIRVRNDYWVCGEGNFTCDAWQTFPLLRWLLVAAAVAPVLLAYFVLLAEKGKYPTGEFTMTVGFAVIVLVAFNGLLDKPGATIEQFGIGLEWGYFVGLLAGFLMAGAGALRSLESGGGAPRKPPGTY